MSAGVPVTAAKRPRTNKPAVPMGALAGRVGLQPQGIQGLQGMQGAQLAGISQPMQMHSQTLAAAATLAGYQLFHFLVSPALCDAPFLPSPSCLYATCVYW